MNQRAAFLDRDGVINVDRGYVWRCEDFQFVPGVLGAAAELRRLGLQLVVATNQSGIGRGLYDEADYRALDHWMRDEFARAGAPLAATYFCPHHPDAAHGAYRRACDCRKPAPGMLLAAARDLGVNLSQSVLFGDKISDLEAARDAGIEQRWLLGTDGHQTPAWPAEPGLATHVSTSLATAVASEDLVRALRPVEGARG